MFNPEHDPIQAIWSAMYEEAIQHPTIDSRGERIFLSRFGPDQDNRSTTLQRLGEEYSISRERVRQLAEKLVKKLIFRASLPKSILGAAIQNIFGEVSRHEEDVGIEQVTRLLVNARCPKPFRELVISCVFARFKWPKEKEKELLSQLNTQLKTLNQERARRDTNKSNSKGRLETAYLLRIFSRAEFPDAFLIDQSTLATTVRTRTADKSSSFFSDKLKRIVGLDSLGERKFLKALDQSDLIADFIEQPFKIPYTVHGNIKYYTPDFLVRTTENIQIVVEVKSPVQIADLIVQTKAKFAKTFLQQKGIAYVLCDSSGITSNTLKDMNVGAELKSMLRDMLRQQPKIAYRDLIQYGGRFPSLSELRGIQALALQHSRLIYRSTFRSQRIGQSPWSAFDFSLELI